MENVLLILFSVTASFAVVYFAKTVAQKYASKIKENKLFFVLWGIWFLAFLAQAIMLRSF
ncbi:hypothetical protein [Mesonia aquimarina]|uniref:hypothetical protein n=1 Tax=Mesonia aquimarina TaxID=1504967 RepID=UPI000EF5AFEF|nr:hypothetical protein [Mesonia aquimarina]